MKRNGLILIRVGEGKDSAASSSHRSLFTTPNQCGLIFQSSNIIKARAGSCMESPWEGGAVALLLHKKDPLFWDSTVLVAPMCKISEKVKPHPMVIRILTRVEDAILAWKIVPTKDVIDSAFKDPAK